MELKNWSLCDADFLVRFYPSKGKMWCSEKLGRNEGSIRWMASQIGLKLDRGSEFCKEWTARGAAKKVGRKRPEQAEVIKRLHREGKLLKTEPQRKAMSERTKSWIAENGHPRGALGMKHTEESKARQSETAKRMWRNKTEKERDEHALRSSLIGQKTTMNRSNASWKAAWREIGEKRKYFRSAWEANYARYLQWLKEKGQIIEWEHEPETFWFDGIKRGCMSYLPDFRVTENDGSHSYHEVKGWMDDRSKTKIRRMEKYHPLVKLIVIDKKAYRGIEKVMSEMICGWEKTRG